jgi:tight adherence protein C
MDTQQLAAVAAGGAVLLLALFIFLTANQRSEVRDALRQLDDYQIENVREQAMLAPAKDRLFRPVIERLARLTGRFTPAGYTDQIRRKIEIAGNPAGIDVDRFLAFKVLCTIAVPGVIWLFRGYLHQSGLIKGLLLPGVVAFCVFMLPDQSINKKMKERQKGISRQLPDILDLLVISVEAGLGFEQAIDRTIASVPGALSDELGRTLQEIRVGKTRADAMRALDARCDVPELRGFVMAILQADQFGVSIGRVLRGQADEMRIKRRQKAQEQAQKAPVKMLFPLMLCIFPSLFVIILGPAAIQISQNL